MGGRRRVVASSRLRIALVALALASGCAKKNDPDGSLPSAAADAGVRIKPVDHLAPGELVEGTDTAKPRSLRADRVRPRREHSIVRADAQDVDRRPHLQRG
jgi:hypothetical protein